MLKNCSNAVKDMAWKIHKGMGYNCLFVMMLFVLSGCGKQRNDSIDSTQKNGDSEQETQAGQETTETTDNISKPGSSNHSSNKILIAYFTLADNYEKPSDMDATSQASINIENKEPIGNKE